MSNVTSLCTAPPVDESGFEDMPLVMSPKTLAAQLETSVPTLQRMRDNRTGPAWHLVGQSIRYSRRDVIEWLASRRVVTRDQD